MEQKVKILNAEYWPDLEVMVWHVEFLKEEKIKRARITSKDKVPSIKEFVLRTEDFKKAVGISGDVSLKQWNDFCGMLKGKVKIIDMESYNHGIDDSVLEKLKQQRRDLKDGKQEDVEKSGLNTSDVQKLASVWHKYPFYEAKVIEETRRHNKEEEQKQE